MIVDLLLTGLVSERCIGYSVVLFLGRLIATPWRCHAFLVFWAIEIGFFALYNTLTSQTRISHPE
jgi:hypothetical protein